MRALVSLLSTALAACVGSRAQPTPTVGLTPSWESRQSERSWAKQGLCAKDEVWKAQFLCAKRFHGHSQKVQGEKENTEAHEICRLVSDYYTCLDGVLHERSCAQDSELIAQAGYFFRVLTNKYRDMCSNEIGHVAKRPKAKVLRTLEASLSDIAEHQTCNEEWAAREFFACGLLFNMIVNRGPPKERTCTAYKDLQKCTRDLQCKVPSDFNVLSMHVLDALLSPYSHYCEGFEPSTRNHTPTPPPTPFSTEAPCNEGVYLEKYFHCGLTFMFSLRDARFQDESQRSSMVCDLVRIHKSCVGTAKSGRNCPTEIEIQRNLDFLDQELRTASGQKCPTRTDKRTGRTHLGASLQYCSVLEYSSTYFTCGATFLQGTYPNRPGTGEACRLYNDFLACIEKLVVCRSQSDIEPSFRHFTEVLTDGYTQTCKVFNRSETCDKLTLLKNFFSCGLTFYQSYNAFLPSYASAGQFICKILEDFTNCTEGRVLINSCGIKELFDNIREVRDYIAKKISRDHQSSCSVPRGVQKTLAALVERQTSCDQFGAVKRVVLCGVAFHRMLASQGNNSAQSTREENVTTAVCPLVKEMKYCMYSATQDSGCSEVRFLNSDISMLKKHLLLAFEDVCAIEPWSEKSAQTRMNGQGCKLKEFTEDWDSCDAAVKKSFNVLHREDSDRLKFTVSAGERQRMCRDFADHHRCVSDTAVRHRCSPLVAQLSDLRQGGMLERLGVLLCASSGLSCLLGGHEPALLVVAGAAYLLASSSMG